MICPRCSGKTGVTYSKPRQDRAVTRRGRRCLACGYYFRTLEVLDVAVISEKLAAVDQMVEHCMSRSQAERSP